MARLTPLHLLPALIATASHAGEMTVETRPFSIVQSFNATALPGESVPIKLTPQAWTGFTIVQIAGHGAKVSKGDVLIRFDSEKIDRQLEDARRAVASGQLALAQAELDFKNLQETGPHKLDALRRAAETAKEENAYFTQTRRKTGEETAAMALKRSEQLLASQREELKQLSRMYESDQSKEEAGKLMLIRQHDAVAAAEFAVRVETLNHKRTMEVTLPREARTLADNERDSALVLKKAEIDIPLSIEVGKLALEQTKAASLRAKQDLAELEGDRTQFEIKAPADGWFHHGLIENGRPAPDEVAKHLVSQGRPPVHQALATFVPVTAKLGLVAFLDDATARSLGTEIAGIATLPGREDLEIPVKLSKLAAAPAADGTFRADFSVTWPKEAAPAMGTAVQVRVISYQLAAAIVVPTRAVHFSPAGWTVEIKLADGKTERRPVKRGRVSQEETEILSGLEVGQVIVIP